MAFGSVSIPLLFHKIKKKIEQLVQMWFQFGMLSNGNNVTNVDDVQSKQMMVADEEARNTIKLVKYASMNCFLLFKHASHLYYTNI